MQVVGSWATGGASLALYLARFEALVPDWGADLKNRNVRVALLAPWVAMALAYVGLAVEDNSSSLWGVPQSEFARVMTHIMDVGAAAAQAEGAAANPGDRPRGSGGRRDDDDDDDDGARFPGRGYAAQRVCAVTEGARGRNGGRAIVLVVGRCSEKWRAL